MTTAETISGVVESRHERGIKVAGEWRNVSKFKPLELPDVGTLVTLGLDPKGFITSLEVVDGAHDDRSIDRSNRDRTISRLAVLKAAAMFGASRSDLKSSDVLKIAASWLAWVEA